MSPKQSVDVLSSTRTCKKAVMGLTEKARWISFSTARFIVLVVVPSVSPRLVDEHGMARAT